MNLVARQIYGNKKGGEPNTFIGGVSSSINTASLLATKLGISVGVISNFTVVGSDIKCRITGSYAMPIDNFLNDTNITYYTDSDGLVTDLLGGNFKGTTQIKELNFKGIITLTGGQIDRNSGVNKVILENCTSITGDFYTDTYTLPKEFYIPKVTTLGSTVLYNTVFYTAPGGQYMVGTTIYCHPILATVNSGGVEGDLSYAIGKGAVVSYVANFTAPNPVTTLASTIYNTALQLNFTAPSSTNTIEYYELYQGGVLQTQRITTSGEYITGLTPSTSYIYTLVAVDIFYNKSVVSNSLSVTTSSGAVTDLAVGAIYDNAVTFSMNSGVYNPSSYKWYDDGILIATTGGKTLSGLTSLTNYTNITVRGVDYYGEAAASNVISSVTTTNTGVWQITTGLVSYYKFDEIIGTKLNDSFKNASLTKSGLKIKQPGKIGNSVVSDAVGDSAYSSSFNAITGNWTINMWCYRTGVNTANAGIIDVGSYGSTGFGIWMNNSGQVSPRVNGNFSNYSGQPILTLNTWEMLTMVYDASAIKTYINGTEVKSLAFTTNPSSSALIRLFNRADDVSQPFTGKLDEISIYNIALTPSDISAHYNSGIGITL